MDIAKKLFTILFGVVVLFGLVLSSHYLRARIQAHINSFLGVIKQAETVKVTFPEGKTNEEMAQILSSRIQNFDAKRFLGITAGEQGYLFPDTYYFLKNETPDAVIKKMQDNFERKTDTLDAKIKFYSSGYEGEKKWWQVVIMASILEKEAKPADMKIVSGILWKRLDNGMLLQADAAPETYKNKGLPEMPISNPGLIAITAAIDPMESPYWYYLHDKNGIIHLAKTFVEHKANIKKYLK